MRRKERGREPDASREHTITEYGSPDCYWHLPEVRGAVGLFLEQEHSGALCSPGSCSGLALTGIGAEVLIPGVPERKSNLEEAQEVTKGHSYASKRGLSQYYL